MSLSKGIGKGFSDDELGTLSLWDVPDVSTGTSEDITLEETEPAVLTADDIDAMQKQAYEEAYIKGEKVGVEEGKKKGLEQGKKQGYAESKYLLEEQAGNLIEVLKSLSEPFERIDAEVERSIVQLSMLIAKQIVKHELKQNPEQIVTVVKEALKVLPVAHNKISVTLHPEDIALLKSGLEKEADISAWNFIEDASLARGGCLLSTAFSQIDQSVENRILEITTRVLDEDISEQAE